MKVEVTANEIVIHVSRNNPPQPSKTGKTLIVATSSGNVTTDAIVDGKPLVVGLNCYIGR